jgi:tetratricopeptide (TPR) repeat protein
MQHTLQLEIREDGRAYRATVVLDDGDPREETLKLRPIIRQASKIGPRGDLAAWLEEVLPEVAGGSSARARKLGQEMFNMLMQGSVRDAYRRALPEEGQEPLLGGGEPDSLLLRLRLPNNLAHLPWELLYDDDLPGDEARRFLVLTDQLGLVRRPQSEAGAQPPPLEGPISIYAVLASPVDESNKFPEVNTQREQELLTNSLQRLIERRHFRLQTVDLPTDFEPSDQPGMPNQFFELEQLHKKQPCHVLHVLCHGQLMPNGEGMLLFEGPNRALLPVQASQLRRLFADQPARLVLLNACVSAASTSDNPFNSVADNLLKAGVLAVIAMQYEILQDDAAVLTETFYRAIAERASVDAALTAARLAIFQREPGGLGWAIPALFLRGASDQLFRRASPDQIVRGMKSIDQGELKRLWQDAQVTCLLKEWDKAIEILQKIVAIEPGYKGAAIKLSDIERAKRIEDLHAQALRDQQLGRWQAALASANELERVAPGHEGAQTLRSWAEAWQQYDNELDAAISAYESHKHDEAVRLLQTALAVRPEKTEREFWPEQLFNQLRNQRLNELKQLVDRTDDPTEWDTVLGKLEQAQELFVDDSAIAELIDGVTAQRTTYVEELFASAKAAYDAGAWDFANEQVQQLLQSQPDYMPALELQQEAEAALKKVDWDKGTLAYLPAGGDFPALGMPPMIGRCLQPAEWDTYITAYPFPKECQRLVLHHTYMPTENQWYGLSTLESLQRYYNSKGWMAGPHIYAAPDGLWLFSPMSQPGIHAGTGNGSIAEGWYSLGLEMVGNYDKQKPAGPVWANALMVMGRLSQRLNIAPDKLISFHRDYTKQKSCPGWAVEREWVLAEVQAWLEQHKAVSN